MNNERKVVWGGGHTFFVYPADLRSWHDVPGVYIFAGVDSTSTWQAKYIGRTDFFKNDMPTDNESWRKAHDMGATHIHAKVVLSLSTRIDLEQALINAYVPPLNPKE